MLITVNPPGPPEFLPLDRAAEHLRITSQELEQCISLRFLPTSVRNNQTVVARADLVGAAGKRSVDHVLWVRKQQKRADAPLELDERVQGREYLTLDSAAQILTQSYGREVRRSTLQRLIDDGRFKKTIDAQGRVWLDAIKYKAEFRACSADAWQIQGDEESVARQAERERRATRQQLADDLETLGIDGTAMAESLQRFDASTNPAQAVFQILADAGRFLRPESFDFRADALSRLRDPKPPASTIDDAADADEGAKLDELKRQKSEVAAQLSRNGSNNALLSKFRNLEREIKQLQVGT